MAERLLTRLSPSGAASFQACPQQYAFHYVWQLPSVAGIAAVTGTLVHEVLDQLYRLPATDRTPEQIPELLDEAWAKLTEESPRDVAVVDGLRDRYAWQQQVLAVALSYFRVENPQRVEPTYREIALSARLDGVLLNGRIDRIDVGRGGAIRIVDYKTGRTPGEAWERKALFQLRMYGVMWRLARDVAPARLLLLYLASGTQLSADTGPEDLDRCEQTLRALIAAIKKAYQTGDWRPRPSKLCDWCSYRPVCPAWGNTPPPMPAVTSPSTGSAGATVVPAASGVAPGSSPPAVTGEALIGAPDTTGAAGNGHTSSL